MTATTTLSGEVAAFATAVRAALVDLPPDELDELTDGLEADLAERLDEAPDAAGGLGDPLAYAEELRAAAGYPPRSARSHLGDTLPNLRTLPQELRRRWNGQLAKHAWLRAIVDFFVALRPVWWVLRGGAVYAIAAALLGINGLAWWPLGVAAIVLSVQLGRGRMLQHRWVLWATRVVSAIVIVAAPLLLGWALNMWNAAIWAGYDQEATYYPQGLTYDGAVVDNIFAYDASGQPVDQVQLFDQNGDPLNTVPGGELSSEYMDAQDGSGAMLVPSGDVPGRAGWNVFPLAHVNDWSDYADDNALDPTEISPTQFPFDTVKPLAGHEPPLQAGTDAGTEVATPAG